MAEKIPIDGIIRKKVSIEDIGKRIKADPVGLALDQVGAENIESAKIDISYLDVNQRAETLWALFQEIKPYLSGRKKTENMEAVNKKIALLKSFYSDPETREVFEENHQKHYQEISQINGNWEKYQALENHREELQKTIDQNHREIFTSRGEGANESDLVLHQVLENSIDEVEKNLNELTANNPKLAALVGYEKTKKWANELQEKGFIWARSRQKILNESIEKALSGSPLLFTGPSGTGKSSVVEQMALVLTGQPNAATPGKDVRFGDLIAKPKISPSGETYYEYKELGEAFTGKKTTLDKEPIHKGLVVADDEFNLMDPAEQNTRVSRIYSWRPGKKVKMPVTNMDEEIAPNSLYAGMVNLAGPKYKRQDIPAEVLRKFAIINVPYIPQSNDDPELYEMLLPGLMDRNGRIRAAKEELSPGYEKQETSDSIEKEGRKTSRNIIKYNLLETEEKDGTVIQAGGFLWRFANALDQMNKSFAGQKTVFDKSKCEGQYIQKLVLDIGKVLGWMERYKEDGRGKSLEGFVLEKMNDEFLNKEAYSATDKQLVKDFLAYYGIDADKKVFEKPGFEILTPLEIGRMSPRVRYYEVTYETPELRTRPATIEGVLVTLHLEGYKNESTGDSYSPGDLIEDPSRPGLFWEYIGYREDNGMPYFEKARKKKTESPKSPEGIVSPERASEIMGEKSFFGKEQVEIAFGFPIPPEKIPPITFSESELLRAKELDQFLVLRVEINGKPLTMEELNNIIQQKLTTLDKGKMLFNTDWYKDEAFFKTLSFKTSWALVSKNIIGEQDPNNSIKLEGGHDISKYETTNKNYLEQAEIIIKYLQEQVYFNQEIPQEYKEAIDEFNSQKSTIENLMGTNWEQAATKLKDLKINQLTRREAVETAYDLAVYLINTNEHLLEGKYDWGKTQSGASSLVYVGYFDPEGAIVNWSSPVNSYGNLGVSFSRTSKPSKQGSI